MSFIQSHKFIAFAAAFLWAALGVLTIGSVVLSSIGWVINVVMGIIFILIGGFLYLRAYYFHDFYMATHADMQTNRSLQRYLRLDTLFVLGILLLGAILLSAGVSRVFGEGYPIFG